jgi:fused signal recognition particle receptor
LAAKRPRILKKLPFRAACQATEIESEPVKSGFFDRMKQAVTRTRESLSSRLEGVLALTRSRRVALEDLESALLTSDIGLPTTTAILEQLRDRALRKDIAGGEELRTLLKEQIRAILEAPRKPVAEPAAPPKVIFW